MASWDTIGIGFFATSGGLLYGDGLKQLVDPGAPWRLYAMLWSGFATLIIGLIVKAASVGAIAEEDEVEGIDFVEHGEAAYDFAASLRGPSGVLTAATPSCPLSGRPKREE